MNWVMILLCVLIMLLSYVSLLFLEQREAYRKRLERNRTLIRRYRG